MNLLCFTRNWYSLSQVKFLPSTNHQSHCHLGYNAVDKKVVRFICTIQDHKQILQLILLCNISLVMGSYDVKIVYS